MTQVKWASAGKVLAVMALLILMGGWLQVGGTGTQQSAYKYPAPRFPRVLNSPPTNVAEVMPYARAIVRNKAGIQGLGMGVMKSGETIAIVVPNGANPIIMEAISRALLERGIKPVLLNSDDLVGVSKQDAEALYNYRQAHAWKGGNGNYEEGCRWFGGSFPNPRVPRNWLKTVRPDLYATCYPPNQIMPASLVAAQKKLRSGPSIGKGPGVGTALVAYLNKHPEITGVFWGGGGSTSLRRDMHPYESKYLGTFEYGTRWTVMTEIPSYPADVWMLSENKTIEPIAFVDQLHVTSPQGTDITANIPAEMAARFARGVYQRGHLYMFPNQSDGRFPYSVVNYPSEQGTWDPRAPLAEINGVIAGTSGETGTMPLCKYYYKNGYLVKVEGGGTFGDLLRTALKYPKINSNVWPYQSGNCPAQPYCSQGEKPGYFYLYEIALGTHPKYFLDLDAAARNSFGIERLRSGVFHFGLGQDFHHGPGGPFPSPQWFAFLKKYNMPGRHDWHVLNFFATYSVHLRNTDKWVNLVYKGHLTSLDNPEVRALASRYGDPNKILAESYIPNMPGINAPGSFQEFASDPWKHYMETRSEILAGTYKYFYPRVAGRQVAANQ